MRRSPPGPEKSSRTVRTVLALSSAWFDPATRLLQGLALTALAIVIARRPATPVIVNQPPPAPPSPPVAVPKGRKRRRRDSDEEVYPRLQERTQGQLGFLNNLLITLTVGVLAFAANGLTSSGEQSHLGWRRWLLFSGLILLALSLLVGLRLAHNRLQSLRLTARVARLRQLGDRYEQEQDSYDKEQLREQAVFLQGWAGAWWVRTKRRERKDIRDKAENLIAKIDKPPEDGQPAGSKGERADTTSTDQTSTAGPDGTDGTGLTTGKDVQKLATAKVAVITKATTNLMKAVRKWYVAADRWTWWWLRAQTVSFILGGALLIVVPLSN